MVAVVGLVSVHIGSQIESNEQIGEEGYLSGAHAKYEIVVATLQVDEEYEINKVNDELADLQLGDVLLPPQVRLNGRAQSSQAIVRVHDCVDERVEQDEQAHGRHGGVHDEHDRSTEGDH